MATLGELKLEFYSVVNQPSTTTLYTEAYIESLLNSEAIKLCDMWKWKFMRKNYLFNSAVTQQSQVGINALDVTVTVDDTTSFMASGYLLIEGEIVKYTGTNGTQFTGCTGITLDHASGCTVEPIYIMPADYGRRPMLYAQDWKPPYDYLDENEYDASLEQHKWTIVYDGLGQGYIRASFPQTTNIAELKYTKRHKTMTDDADASDIPDPYSYSVLANLAAGRAMQIRGDDVEGLGSKVRAIGEQQLLEMKKFYSEREQPASKKLTVDYKSSSPRIGDNVTNRHPMQP